MGAYKYIQALWKKPKENLGDIQKQRLIKWRREHTVVRVEHPTRIDRARTLGYKAKQGVIVARARVSKGGHERPRHKKGRKPKNAGFFYTLAKSHQSVAEEKAGRKFPNTEVLNSYWVGADGRHKWYEVILIDKAHPAMQNDKDLGWITNPVHTRRAFRGLTSSGKKHRGLRNKGKGAEKMRPSVRKRMK